MGDRSKKARRIARRTFFAGVGATASALAFPAIGRAAARTKTVVVLGMDGMDPALLTRFIREGRMPNAVRLIERGSFAPLGTSNPPQSPVAWSNFISGTNPGGHGIFDFITRDPATSYMPTFSASALQGESTNLSLGKWQIPLRSPTMKNLRGGATFWNNLQESGMDCTVLRMPANFPPVPTEARTLSGLGTPDIHGSYGLFSFYTNEPSEVTRDVSGGRIEHVNVIHHAARCTLPGPVNSFDRTKPKADIPFTAFVDPTNSVVKISIQESEFILREGEWSKWITVKFPMLPHLVDVSGTCRFFLKQVRPDFALYVSPVNLDPAAPALPLSTPAGYAGEIAGRIGKFYTQGMPEDTSALSRGVLNDDDYRHQATLVHRENLAMFDSEFGRFQKGFYFHYFSSLDLNSHAFWRTLDRGHPLYSPELAKKHGDFLPWLYSEMDKAMGKAMNRLDEDALLMVISDHGFGSFRRQFNLNSWLLDNGYAVPAGRSAERSGDPLFRDIKWDGTRAYGLGINGLYLNRRGREPNGCVDRGVEEESLASELIERLTSLRDSETGAQVVSGVYRSRDIYSGPYVDKAPDLIVGYNRYYRASWETILGGYPKDHILDNTDPWSGDHTMDSKLLPGVFLCNRKIRNAEPALHDLTPSILQACGVPVPKEMTGKNVL